MPDYPETPYVDGCVQIRERLGRHIANLAALDTSHMVMLMHAAIVLSLPATGLQPLYQPRPAEDLQIPIHRPQADPRHHPPHPFVHLVGRQMPPTPGSNNSGLRTPDSGLPAPDSGPRTPDSGLRIGPPDLIEYESPLSGHPHTGRRAVCALLIHNDNCYYSMVSRPLVNCRGTIKPPAIRIAGYH